MLHIKLLELESEIIAREESQRAAALAQLPPECEILRQAVEREIGLRLADSAPAGWRGWLTYRRGETELLVIRGRAFKDNAIFAAKTRAGLDFSGGADSISEYARHFDVSAPQELDHLMINFGVGDTDSGARLFLWYGENLAPYRLIFEEDISSGSETALLDAIAEGLSWIVAKPKEMTLPQFLKSTQK
jgi:hypothetical protein